LLDRWAFHRAEGTKHTAIPRIRAQQGFALFTFIEKLAGIGGHSFLFGKSTVRASQDRFQNNVSHVFEAHRFLQ
jgi:hypothetical protein